MRWYKTYELKKGPLGIFFDQLRHQKWDTYLSSIFFHDSFCAKFCYSRRDQVPSFVVIGTNLKNRFFLLVPPSTEGGRMGGGRAAGVASVNVV